ncbi:MAG: proton-coupled thiamine transporter YuaJ [Oscillospiraceae bacterium]|nr:proton-coupled thiamine transporter YuaJ [Oscillospiraceae bacterium]
MTNVTAKTNSRLRERLLTLCEGAMMVVLAQILGYLKLWEMPWGGSICLSMFPIIFFALRRGLKPGLMAAFVFGVLQFLYDGGFALMWQAIFLDYLFAFTALGLAGLGKGRPGGVYWGALLAGVGRFLFHYVAGATIWAVYMPEVFFGLTMTSPWFYSLLYNGFYMAIDTVLCLILFALVSNTPLKSWLYGDESVPQQKSQQEKDPWD